MDTHAVKRHRVVLFWTIACEAAMRAKALFSRKANAADIPLMNWSTFLMSGIEDSLEEAPAIRGSTGRRSTLLRSRTAPARRHYCEEATPKRASSAASPPTAAARASHTTCSGPGLHSRSAAVGEGEAAR